MLKQQIVMVFKNILLLVTFIALFSMVSCKNENKSITMNDVTTEIQTKKTPQLELIWETDTLLSTCEAVLYDKASKLIYVSNINNNPWGKDDNGFISIIDTKGKIIDLKWAEGLSAPKGLGISNNKLYVNDIDKVVEIDVTSKRITNSYFVEGDPQLNDITVDYNGDVYSSGSNSNTIYKIHNGELSVYASDNLKRLNGLLYQKEGIYCLDSGNHHFGIFEHDSNKFKILTEDIGHGDGIIRLKNGDFITSSWKGEIFYINSSDWRKTLLLDTRTESINAADIDFIHETNTLLVPTFFHNTVMAYRLK